MIFSLSKIVESKTNSTYESFADWSTIKKVELYFDVFCSSKVCLSYL